MKLLLKSWRAFGSRGVEDEHRDGVKKEKKKSVGHTRVGVGKLISTHCGQHSTKGGWLDGIGWQDGHRKIKKTSTPWMVWKRK